MRIPLRTAPGFTLVEAGVILGVMVILVGMYAALGNRAIQNMEFHRVRELVRTELSAAQADTIAGTRDARWGVAFFPNSLVRYQGSSYASRVTAFDLTKTFSNAVVISGTSDVAFTRPYGLPVSSASIVISDGANTSTITVNVAGRIDAP